MTTASSSTSLSARCEFPIPYHSFIPQYSLFSDIHLNSPLTLTITTQLVTSCAMSMNVMANVPQWPDNHNLRSWLNLWQSTLPVPHNNLGYQVPTTIPDYQGWATSRDVQNALCKSRASFSLHCVPGCPRDSHYHSKKCCKGIAGTMTCSFFFFTLTKIKY